MTDTKAPEETAQRSLADLADLLGIDESADTGTGLPHSLALIGAPGTGKTLAAGSIVKVPEFKDAQIAYVDLELGTSVWAQDPQIWSERYHPTKNPGGHIHHFPIKAGNTVEAKAQIDKLFGYRDESGQKRLGALFSPAFNVDVIIVDTFDRLQSVGFDYFMATAKTKDGRQDPQAAYGMLGPWTTDIAWNLQTGSPISILLAHEMEKVDARTGQPVITMNLKGGSKESVPSAPDLVARLSKRDVIEGEGDEAHEVTRYVAELAGTETALLKNRYGFTEPLWDFSLPRLYAAINQKIQSTEAVIASVKSGKNNK